jgi:hypothetical protein
MIGNSSLLNWSSSACLRSLSPVSQRGVNELNRKVSERDRDDDDQSLGKEQLHSGRPSENVESNEQQNNEDNHFDRAVEQIEKEIIELSFCF